MENQRRQSINVLVMPDNNIVGVFTDKATAEQLAKKVNDAVYGKEDYCTLAHVVTVELDSIKGAMKEYRYWSKEEVKVLDRKSLTEVKTSRRSK